MAALLHDHPAILLGRPDRIDAGPARQAAVARNVRDHQVGALARLKWADVVAEAAGERRVDRDGNRRLRRGQSEALAGDAQPVENGAGR